MPHSHAKERCTRAVALLKTNDCVCLESPDVLIICQNAEDHPALLARLAELIAAEKYPAQDASGPVFPDF